MQNLDVPTLAEIRGWMQVYTLKNGRFDSLWEQFLHGHRHTLFACAVGLFTVKSTRRGLWQKRNDDNGFPKNAVVVRGDGQFWKYIGVGGAAIPKRVMGEPRRYQFSSLHDGYGIDR
ncbi:MAG: hypothetical protein BroJett018_33610 [Chloroflexota bacterium]|nr:MAG: hypothetical protein BroJett018_33610 [Chloroflexota bacterium]